MEVPLQGHRSTMPTVWRKIRMQMIQTRSGIVRSILIQKARVFIYGTGIILRCRRGLSRKTLFVQAVIGTHIVLIIQ